MKTFLYFVTFIFLLSNCKNDDSVAKSVTVINEGIPGNTAENLLSRINSVIGKKPNLVIIMVGTNDAKSGTNVYESFGSTLSLIVDSLKDTGSSVMLLTPPPIANWSSYFQYNPLLNNNCDTIHKLSEAKGCYFVDVNSDLAQAITTANSHALYITDGLHPSAASYTDIARYISDYMNAKKIIAAKIVCFGDSITYGVDMTGQGTATGNTYPGLLSQDLNAVN